MHTGRFQKIESGFVQLIKGKSDLIFTKDNPGNSGFAVNGNRMLRRIGKLGNSDHFPDGRSALIIVNPKTAEAPVVSIKPLGADHNRQAGKFMTIVTPVMRSVFADSKEFRHGG